MEKLQSGPKTLLGILSGLASRLSCSFLIFELFDSG